jgi:hypothetical protein
MRREIVTDTPILRPVGPHIFFNLIAYFVILIGLDTNLFQIQIFYCINNQTYCYHYVVIT